MFFFIPTQPYILFVYPIIPSAYPLQPFAYPLCILLQPWLSVCFATSYHVSYYTEYGDCAEEHIFTMDQAEFNQAKYFSV